MAVLSLSCPEIKQAYLSVQILNRGGNAVLKTKRAASANAALHRLAASLESPLFGASAGGENHFVFGIVTRCSGCDS